MLELGDQNEIGLLGAFALGDVEHDTVEARRLSILEDRLAARRDPSCRAAVDADDAILDVADAVAVGVDARAKCGLNALSILGMNAADEHAEIHRLPTPEVPRSP